MPAAGPGQLLLRTRLLSLDPYMRGRMSDAPSYAEPVAVGAADDRADGQRGRGLERGRIRGGRSGARHGRLAGLRGSRRAACRQDRPCRSPSSPTHSACWACPDSPPTWDFWTSGSRSPGRRWSWRPRPGRSVRSSARSPSSRAARVVGIAGGAEKCDFAVETLGFDACIDHRDPNLRELLARRAPRASMSTSRMSAVRCSPRCCRC